MNRYALGGAVALLLLLALSGVGGINRMFRDNNQLRSGLRADDSNLGTLPIEQAGQVVQRQSTTTPGMPATGNSATGAMPSFEGDLTPAPTGGSFTTPGGTPPTISPTPPAMNPPQNVIPRQGVTTLPAQVGDIAPVQPGLVQPDPPLPITDDPELESIPALW